MKIGNLEPLPRLRINITAMAMVQIGNFIVPMISLPYLTRVLGVESYGRVALAQALVMVFALLVDYGFSLSASQKVAANRSKQSEVNRIFAATWAAQWLLVIVSILLATTIVAATDRLRADACLYAVAFSTIVAAPLFPVWFLQGIERLQVVALLQLLARTVSLIPIFLLIKRPEDAIWFLGIQGATAIIAGLLSLWWINRQSYLAWTRPNWYDTLQALREGSVLFGSRASISFYTTLVPLVLGWFAGPAALAHFNLADKLRIAAQSLLTPISQALYPRMSYLTGKDDNAAYVLVKRTTLAVVLIGGSASIALWVCSDWLVAFLGGDDFAPAAQVLRWLSPLPLLTGISNVMSLQVIIPRGLTRPLGLILASAAALSLLLIGFMTQNYGARGAAQTVLIVEIWVAASMFTILFRGGYFSLRMWRAN